ncbi:MAG: type II secretion system protein GspC [Halioglobus sp.]
MSAQWLNNSSEWSARVAAAIEPFSQRLAKPENLRRLRLLLVALFALWAVLALARIIWALVPAGESDAAVPAQVINPVTRSGPAQSATQLDIDKMRGWHLFGKAGATAPPPPVEQTVATARDGIEEGARDTRLNLKLRGIVASTEDGLGHAIIEYQSKQAVYAVEDKLPVQGKVTLAKVMRDQVILDNRGTYERLKLFEKSALDNATVLNAPSKVAAEQAAKRSIDKRNENEITQLANSYRERLYESPQTLAKVVNISAVRENGNLQGYRVSPGQERDQFTQLGFKSGDLVTGVNGVPLDNPANTMKLYTMLRSANEVVFELQRNGQPMTLSVSLDGNGQ